MPLVTPPKETDDSRDTWKPVEKIAKFINALGNLRIIRSTVRDKLTLTESNATLELMLGSGGVAVATAAPWQPEAAPFLGVGTPPDDQGLKFKIRPCWVWDGYQCWFASNKNAVFTAPPNCTDGYFSWLKASVAPTGQITSLVIENGASGPPRAPDANAVTGAPPSLAYYALGHVTSNATAIDDFSNVYAPPEPLALLPITVVISNTASFPQRLMRWYPFTADGVGGHV